MPGLGQEAAPGMTIGDLNAPFFLPSSPGLPQAEPGDPLFEHFERLDARARLRRPGHDDGEIWELKLPKHKAERAQRKRAASEDAAPFLSKRW
jgi:hypothetical protein